MQSGDFVAVVSSSSYLRAVLSLRGGRWLLVVRVMVVMAMVMIVRIATMHAKRVIAILHVLGLK